jgi:hypothetical protein
MLEDGASKSEPPTSDATDLPLTAPLVASTAAAPAIGYADFAAAVKDALRDLHSPDLLARNPSAPPRRLQPGQAGGAAGAEGIAVRDRPHIVRQSAGRETAPSAQADLLPTRPEAGGGGGSAFSFLRDLPPSARYRARTPGALAVGELAGRAGPTRAAVCGAADRKGREVRRRNSNYARSRRARSAAALRCRSAVPQHRRQCRGRPLCRRHHRNADHGSLS